MGGPLPSLGPEEARKEAVSLGLSEDSGYRMVRQFKQMAIPKVKSLKARIPTLPTSNCGMHSRLSGTRHKKRIIN